MTVRVGQRVTCTVEDLAFGGAGVARLEGMALFVEDAIPGEEVIAEITMVGRRFARGRALKISVRSGERVDPPCRYYGKCGGCQLQHLRYGSQVEWKKKQVFELLKRIGGLRDFHLTGGVASPNSYGYRNTIRLHRLPGVPVRYGFYCRDGRSLIAVSRCLIAVRAINEVLSSGKIFSASARGHRQIILHADAENKVAVCSDRESAPDVAEMLCGARFSAHPASFFQVNRAVAAMLVEKIREWTESGACLGTFFDLYCGVGVFSVLLAGPFSRVIGIDHDARAIARAQANSVSMAQRKFSYVSAKVENSLQEICDRHIASGSVVLLDPPRAGVGEGVVNYLRKADRRLEKIIYVSCNPATLARDLNRLCANGTWRLDEVMVFDMFPQTSHIEACCSIVRKGGTDGENGSTRGMTGGIIP
jgi:23S rRNA (uracil1939-C5)-methyltransferase